ncbi:MAG: hypothetical protein P4L20_13205 [Acidimicrobiales bacterium]|nr:hypothetical protein [Acidimicrobiales bacterium]
MPVDSSGLADQARRQARHILSQPPFRPSTHRSAFDRFFHDLGHWLSDVVGPVWRFLVRHLFNPVRDGLSGPFGSWWPVPLGMAVVVVAVVVGLRLARTRARVGVTRAQSAAQMRDEDPGELERAADQAETVGDYELAVRLRFRAGLARLERSGLITGRRTHTSSQLAQLLRSPTFDSLAGHLDRIVYAGLPATADHVGAARSGWPRIPVEARQAATVGAGAGAGAGADHEPPQPTTPS